jgi:murein DD-endopeptidase MepM/ murein hydrolase activator NlpD
MLFKRKKIAYYYDSETCTYERVTLSPLKWVKRSGLFISLSLALGVLVSLVLRSEVLSWKADKLRDDQAFLLSQVVKNEGEIKNLENLMDEMFQRDKGLYIPIVGATDIPENTWEGGRGGTERYNVDLKDKVTEAEIRLERLRHQINLLQVSLKEVLLKADGKAIELKNLPSILPVRGTLISGFGMRSHPVYGRGHFHTGLDFACPVGTPIHASGDGIVSFAGGDDNGYGIQVDIDHQNGFQTKYAHLSRVVVAPGKQVKRGEMIGYSGSTGLSTGPHLHYEIMKGGVKIDPIDYFYADMTPSSFLRAKLEAAPMDAPTGNEASAGEDQQ